VKLLSPARRRLAVEHVRQHLAVSERQACRVLGQPRGSCSDPPRPLSERDAS